MMDDNAVSTESVDQALELLEKSIQDYQRLHPVSFEMFLNILKDRPSRILRNIFQSFHDMVKAHVDEYKDPVTGEQDNLAFTRYDCTRLFVEGSDNPYFPDMLFANRFMKQMEYLRHGAQQNRIYIFYGPHGCGKSTFLNNLLKKFESYANTDEGLRYEIVWRLNIKKLHDQDHSLSLSAFERLIQYVEKENEASGNKPEELSLAIHERDYIEVPCLAHDNPFLLKILSELEKEEPNSHRVHYFKGMGYIGTGNYDRAKSSISRAVELNPEYLKARMLLADIHLQERSFERARDAATEALALDPDNYRLLLIRAKSHMGLRQFKEAETDLLALVQGQPQNPTGHYQLGLLKAGLQDFDAA
ncbi:MAG: tetratricopeptide repeat protein, partial [Desulfotignum sp.]